MTHTKARRHEVKNGKSRSSETFVPSCLRVRLPHIAPCLIHLDARITAESHELGLMQQLFPSTEEVTDS
jgi:hypothetical protein